MWKLGNKEYVHKTAVRARAQEILYRFKDVTPGTDDFDFLLALLRAHPRGEKKIGAGVEWFFIEHDEYSAPNFGVRRTDGTEVDFSFYKCVSALGRTQEEIARTEAAEYLAAAYRTAVWGDIQTFRAAQERICAICGNFIEDTVEVDHYAPTFLELTRQFEKVCGLQAPQEFDECGEARGYHPYAKKFRAMDATYEAAWVVYHRAHAVLRVTCAHCNLERSRSMEVKLV